MFQTTASSLRNLSWSLMLASLTPWTANVANAGDTIVFSPTLSGPQIEAVKEYWTPERLRSSRPIPIPKLDHQPIPADASEIVPDGAPGVRNGAPPAGAKGAGGTTASLAALPTPKLGPGSTVWYDYPPPHTTYDVLGTNVRRQYPMSTFGKLYFTKTDGRNFVCSASVVNTAGPWGEGNHQMVVTAGHCCAEGDGASWHNNWLFIPAYWNGSEPFGRWTGASAAVFTSWFNNGDFSRDVCAIQLNTQDGVNAQDVTGSLGYAWNYGLPLAYTTAGYPAEAPFDGQRLWVSTTSTAETDTYQAGELPFTQGAGTSMNRGSSGGPWVVALNPGGGLGNWLVSVNSYLYRSRPNELFGPYFDDAVANELFAAVAQLPPAP